MVMVVVMVMVMVMLMVMVIVMMMVVAMGGQVGGNNSTFMAGYFTLKQGYQGLYRPHEVIESQKVYGTSLRGAEDGQELDTILVYILCILMSSFFLPKLVSEGSVVG